MMPLFISIGFFDILDILLVAYLLYQLYRLIKGTIAINIFIGILILLLVWWVVKVLNMNLLSTILGSVVGVGAIAIIIVFQQEIRRFLLMLGTQDILNQKNPFQKFFSTDYSDITNDSLKHIVRACRNMAKTQTGALIVLSVHSELLTYVQSGDYINSEVNHRMLETIFFKNSPMHDGAVIIVGNKIKAARCVLPIDEKLTLPAHLGLRHRAAMSMAMETDTTVITVSEETGKISYARGNELKTDVTHEALFAYLIKEYLVNSARK